VRPKKNAPRAMLKVCGYTWKLKGAQPPALLSTCRDARNEVLVRYGKPRLIERFGKPGLHYFNPDIDVVCVSQGVLWRDGGLLVFEMVLRGNIKTLAIRVEKSRYERDGIDTSLEVL
jgi:hypothetical protein